MISHPGSSDGAQTGGGHEPPGAAGRPSPADSRAASADTFRLRLADRLRPLADPVEIQAEAARALGQHLGVSRVHYAEVSEDDAYVLVERDYTDGVVGLTGRFFMADFGPAFIRALREGQTLVVPDVANSPALSPAERAAYAGIAVAAQVGVPLSKGGRLAAVLAVHQSTPRAWTVAEIAIIEETAERTWAAVERAKAEAALRTLNETLEQRVAERTAELHESRERLRHVASLLTMAEHEERRRISHILHDDLQQQLYSVQMKLSSACCKAKAGDLPAAQKCLAEAEQWLHEGVEITRRLSVDLSPPILKGEGLADALGWLVRQMQELHGLDVSLVAEHAFCMSDRDMRLLLFQVVRELLFNTVKHAGTDRATVELREEDGGLVVCIRDEGRGFDVEASAARVGRGGGLGLFSVRERLALFGGSLEVMSAPGQGTRITVKVPVQLAAPPAPASVPPARPGNP